MCPCSRRGGGSCADFNKDDGVFLLISGMGHFDATRTRAKYQKTLLTQSKILGYRLDLSKLLK